MNRYWNRISPRSVYFHTLRRFVQFRRLVRCYNICSISSVLCKPVVNRSPYRPLPSFRQSLHLLYCRAKLQNGKFFIKWAKNSYTSNERENNNHIPEMGQESKVTNCQHYTNVILLTVKINMYFQWKKHCI